MIIFWSLFDVSQYQMLKIFDIIGDSYKNLKTNICKYLFCNRYSENCNSFSFVCLAASYLWRLLLQVSTFGWVVWHQPLKICITKAKIIVKRFMNIIFFNKQFKVFVNCLLTGKIEISGTNNGWFQKIFKHIWVTTESGSF